MSADTESHDDVAGLFKRLGRNDDSRQYHDFSGAPVLPGKPPKVSAPAAVAAEAAPPAVAVAAPAQAVVATPAEPAVVPAAAAGPSTALDVLFQRLLQAPLRPSAQSPLARLRVR